VQVEIDQGEVRAEPVMVLRDATIAHPVEAEDAFQDAVCTSAASWIASVWP
jgi:hypothetical protein